MSALLEIIDYVKEDGQITDCVEQVVLAEKAAAEFNDMQISIARLGELESQNAKLRAACDLAYGHLIVCDDRESDSAACGAAALTAIRAALHIDGEK